MEPATALADEKPRAPLSLASRGLPVSGLQWLYRAWTNSMDSIVTLGLGRLETDWGKRRRYANHSKLFLATDFKPVPYYFSDLETAGVEERLKPGLARPLRSVKRRLELLGYTLSEVERHFESISRDSDLHEPPVVSFDAFVRALAAVDVHRISLDPWFMDHSPGGFVTYSIFSDPEFAKTIQGLDGLSRFHGLFFEDLDPYVILRLLAENPANLEVEVQWRFTDSMEDG